MILVQTKRFKMLNKDTYNSWTDSKLFDESTPLYQVKSWLKSDI